MNIPPEFWKSLTEEEFFKVCETSQLNHTLTKKLWAMLGRTDQPPNVMTVVLNAADVMRAFPAQIR